jgi:hypothetical protein
MFVAFDTFLCCEEVYNVGASVFLAFIEWEFGSEVLNCS